MRALIFGISTFLLIGSPFLVLAQSKTLYISRGDSRRNVTMVPLESVRRTSDKSLWYKIAAGFAILGLASLAIARRRKPPAAIQKAEIKTVQKAPDPISILQAKDQSSLQSPSAEFFVLPKRSVDSNVVDTQHQAPQQKSLSDESNPKRDFKFSEAFLNRMAKLTNSSDESKD